MILTNVSRRLRSCTFTGGEAINAIYASLSGDCVDPSNHAAEAETTSERES
jgi:hypothetical protein